MSDDDKFWNKYAPKLAKRLGLAPLTPAEAEAAYDAAPSVPLTAEEVAAIVAYATDPKK